MTRQRKPRTKQPAKPVDRPKVDGLKWSHEIPEERVDWLLPGGIPARSLTLLEGRKSTGKSSFLAAIAAHVTGGSPLPGCTLTEGRAVIWIAGEDHWPSVVIPRLRAAGARIELVAQPECRDSHGRPRRLSLPGDLLILQDMIRDSGAGLLVLDPFASAIDSHLDMRIEQQARQYCEPILQLMGSTGCTCVMSRHIRKGQGGDARDAGLGSVAVGNTARAILRCDEHPHMPGQYVMSVVASNLGRRRATLVYQIVSAPNGYGRIQWCGDIDLDADAIAEGRGGEGDRDEWGDADRLLAEVIGSAWIQVGTLLREIDAAGISPRTLRRAARLRIPSRRVQQGDSGCWEWGPPAGGWPSGILGLPTLAPLPAVAAEKPLKSRRKRTKRSPKGAASDGEGGTHADVATLVGKSGEEVENGGS